MGASLIIIMNAISNAEKAEKEAKEKEKQRKLDEEETRKYEAEQRKNGLIKVKYLINTDGCYTHSYRNQSALIWRWIYNLALVAISIFCIYKGCVTQDGIWAVGAVAPWALMFLITMSTDTTYSWLYTKDSGQPHNPGYKYLGYEYKPWYGEKWVTKEESKKYVAV
jgi:hypothetical protein